MVSICWHYDSGSGVTEDIEFIQSVYGREPQLHETWCLGLDNITSKIHPTAWLEVGTGTVREFTTNHLAENGCIISIIDKISINRSVQILGIPNFVRNSGLSFIEKLKDPTVPNSWGHANTTNQNWGVIPGFPYSMWSFPWGSTITASPDYIHRSTENPRAAERCVRN